MAATEELEELRELEAKLDERELDDRTLEELLELDDTTLEELRELDAMLDERELDMMLEARELLLTTVAELTLDLLDDELEILEGWLLVTELLEAAKLDAALEAGALLIIIGVLEVLPEGPPSSPAPPPQPVTRTASKIEDVEDIKCLYMMTP